MPAVRSTDTTAPWARPWQFTLVPTDQPGNPESWPYEHIGGEVTIRTLDMPQVGRLDSSLPARDRPCARHVAHTAWLLRARRPLPASPPCTAPGVAPLTHVRMHESTPADH